VAFLPHPLLFGDLVRRRERPERQKAEMLTG
jgi:hypothetical protein